MAQNSYTDYVIAHSRRNPCLTNLCHFLAENLPRNSPRIVSLMLSEPEKSPIRQDLNFGSLQSLLTDPCLKKSSNKPLGQLLIVEDLTNDLVELLGSKLDIDPLFFASHIYGPEVNIQSSKPATAILPSQRRKQNFVSLQYQHSLEFDDHATGLRKLSSEGNVPRKVMVLPRTQNTNIGLAQHSCSVLLTDVKGDGWLGERRNCFLNRKADYGRARLGRRSH